MELLLSGCLVVVAAALVCWQSWRQERRINDLMNRLMARDYREYAAVEKAVRNDVSRATTVAQELMSDKDIYPVN